MKITLSRKDVIKLYIDAAGLTYSDVSKACGLTTGTISNMMSRRGYLSEPFLEKFEAHYGDPAAALMGALKEMTE